MVTFKWGSIGPGNIAETFLQDLKRASSAHHIVNAVFHKEKEKASAFAGKWEIPYYYDSIHEMAKDCHMDAVYIATPHPFHHKEALICLEQRIPVLCEKPLAINKMQVEEMIASSRRNQTFLMEGMWIRFLPSIKQVMEICDQGLIGDIVSLHANLSYVAPKDSGSRYFNPVLGGGSLLDLGIYPVYLAVLLMGKPIAISSHARVNADQIDEHCIINLEFLRKSFAVCESSLITNTGNIADICGTKGSIRICKPWNEMPECIELSDTDGNITRIPSGWEGHGFQYEVDEVLRCIEKNQLESPALTHSTSLCVMEILDTVRQQNGIYYPFDSPVPAGQKLTSL